ncbi:Vitamin B12 import ATP-binding protein BtuD [Sinobacterium norvegicum]|uniref:Vitamin B12 import ATP-binding protein BtuD n=1 Tax=Sinobacterium norvegicum TaxID=1641715 RepID=A0ABM9AGE4_9GAMM|nr:ABC transporter ATP-binding protein [Sinobacterium norvegicum]CAH0992278.1 Vitamin B12 import ATP-binding protein BtuD [Sinobacterium norvegicum]
MGSITVKNLGKAYKRYATPWSRLREWLFFWAPPRHQASWVLRGVSFEIGAGEAIGIAGVNGAGKSTLLKLITGTTVASEGSVEVEGRVAALLELGMGFHPDFTGRQNAFMAGQLLGLSMQEIAKLMPHIEEFAEIGRYIDDPVRTYSSGMQVRLAFSVATALRPDILIVDEALSVGDAYFQHKSFARIREFREAGTTLLIVSHDRTAIQSICDRAILLHNGGVEKSGFPEEVMDYYHALMSEREGELIKQKILQDGSVQTTSGSGEVSLQSIELLDQSGIAKSLIEVCEPVNLKLKIIINETVSSLVVGFMIKDSLGQTVYGINTGRLDKLEKDLQAGEELDVSFLFDGNFGMGNYSISIALTRSDSHLDKTFEWRDRAMVFSVVNTNKEQFVGLAWMDVEASIRRLQHNVERIGVRDE